MLGLYLFCTLPRAEYCVAAAARLGQMLCLDSVELSDDLRRFLRLPAVISAPPFDHFLARIILLLIFMS